MWLTLLKFAGRPKVLLSAGVALLVGLIFWTMIQYGEDKEKTRVIIEEQQNYIATRKRIDDATSRPALTVDDARSRLLNRQSSDK
jgi:hypothetical protein